MKTTQKTSTLNQTQKRSDQIKFTSFSKTARALFESFVLISSLAVGSVSNAYTEAQNEVHKNSKIVSKLVTAFTKGKTHFVSDVFDTNFVDHLTGQTGLVPLTNHVEAEFRKYPKSKIKIYRVIAENDLVFVHSHLIKEPNTLGYAYGEIYKFKDGKIIERWVGHQAVPEKTVSGNDMFSTLTSPVRYSPDLKIAASATNQVVNSLFQSILVDKDLTGFDRYIHPSYYQHNTTSANGVEAVKEAWGPFLLDPNNKFNMINMLTQGDLYIAQSIIETLSSKIQAFDIFRVRDGKIVEHWDVFQVY